MGERHGQLVKEVSSCSDPVVSRTTRTCSGSEEAGGQGRTSETDVHAEPRGSWF